MNYEKKYKEALGWMQGMYGGLHGKTREEAEKYFPELKESEDERIRKELIEHIKANECADYVLFKKFSPADIISWLEKQCEQKPKWTEEDSLMIDSIIDTIKWLEGKGATNMKIDWLKSVKKRMEEQK